MKTINRLAAGFAAGSVREDRHLQQAASRHGASMGRGVVAAAPQTVARLSGITVNGGSAVNWLYR